MSVHLPIELDQEQIGDFCRAHGIKKLSLFGSVLRDDFDSASDLDVLVEFDEAAVPDFFALAEMEDELSALTGHKVDMRTPKELSRYFRDDVVRNAIVQYAE